MPSILDSGPGPGRHGMTAFKQQCLDYVMRMHDKLGYIPSVHLCSSGFLDAAGNPEVGVAGISDVYYFFEKDSTFQIVQETCRLHSQGSKARFSCLVFSCWAYVQYEPDYLGLAQTKGKIKGFMLEFTHQLTPEKEAALRQMADAGFGTQLFRCATLVYEELRGSEAWNTTTLLLFRSIWEAPGNVLCDFIEFSDDHETNFSVNDLGRRILSNNIHRPRPPEPPDDLSSA